MLDPDYIQKLSDGAEEIASQLHTDVVKRIVQRILLRLQRKDGYLLTALDKCQLGTLQEAGFLRADLEKEIAKATGIQVKEIKRAFENAGVRTVTWDNAIYTAAGLSPDPLLNSPSLLALLDRGYRKTLGEWRNYTGTTAEAGQQLFIQVCDRAYHQVASGALSYTQAVAEAVEQVSRDGVEVHYPTGWTDTIETATLRAVRTGVSQACAEITEARMEELGWDIVLVSAHLGARVGDGDEDFTNHAWWQGKFYSRSGKDSRFPPLEVCGMGEIQGLCGINCRHSIGPGDGVNNPYEGYDSEENRKRYELEQRQRLLERRIRKTRREVMGLKTGVEGADPEARPELEVKYQQKARLLQKQNQEYRQFCADNDLKPLDDRLKIAGWDRKQAAAAVGTVKKDDAALAFIRNDAIIKAKSGLPVKLENLPQETLKLTVPVNMEKTKALPNGFHAVVPKGVALTEMEVQAGMGTSTPIRDLPRLYARYHLDPRKWQKKSGTAYGAGYHYVVHWYENDGVVPEDEIKLKGMKKNP